MLNGNRVGFVEPMEATSTGFYQLCCRNYFGLMTDTNNKVQCNHNIRKHMKHIQNFILWTYRKGSKYDTPFWKYAQSLPFKPDHEFTSILKQSRSLERVGARFRVDHQLSPIYGQWNLWTFKMWEKDLS